MWSLVYLALAGSLEILPWHVSSGCCPQESSAGGAIHRERSAVWGGLQQQVSTTALALEMEAEEGTARIDFSSEPQNECQNT